MKAQNRIGRSDGQAGEAAAPAVAAMIRQSSEKGRLLAKPEILRQVSDQHLFDSPASDSAEEMGTLIRKLVDETEDLQELMAPNAVPHYYSSRFMTEVYATILLQKQGDPLRLIAECVRRNSEVYPRPIPLDMFAQQPFDLTRQEVLACVEQMRAEKEYRDIASTTTSASRTFLYSTRHLEPEHASMLAEWLDVGQSKNP